MSSNSFSQEWDDSRSLSISSFDDLYNSEGFSFDFYTYNLNSKSNVKSQKRKKKTKTALSVSKLSDKVEKMMFMANDAYLAKDIEKAVAILQDTIRESQNIHDPYLLLGLIYENELFDTEKALECYMIATTFIPDDHSLWNRIGYMSKSQGKYLQAIHAFKKSIRASNIAGLTLDEDSLFCLAELYFEMRKYDRAATKFKILFDKYPGDTFLGLKLSECYYQKNCLVEACQILEICISKVLSDQQTQETNSKFHLDHLNVVNVLAELYLTLEKYFECELVLKKYLGEQSLDLIPLDLSMKLAITQTYLGNYKSHYVTYILDRIINNDIPKHYYLDLYKMLANALFSSKQYTTALKIFVSLATTNLFQRDTELWIKMAKCYLELSKKNPNDIENNPTNINTNTTDTNTKARLLLSEALTKIGRTHESENFFLSVNELNDKKEDHDGEPFSNVALISERKKKFATLKDELKTIVEYCSNRVVDSNTHSSIINWINDFLTFIQTCESDSSRIFRYNIYKKLKYIELDSKNQLEFLESLGYNYESNVDFINVTSKNTLLKDSDIPSFNSKFEIVNTLNPLDFTSLQYTASNQTINAKQIFGLLPIEEIIGWDAFNDFLVKATSIVMKYAGMDVEAVELLETIIASRKSIRTQPFDLEKKRFFQNIKHVSLKLSIDCGLYRVALSHIKEIYISNPDQSNRALQLFGRLLFSGKFSHFTIHGLSSSKEKDILLENRTWCVRQLLQKPYSFILTLLVGHFCSLSGRWVLAVSEYIRAHRLVPEDDLTCLCLAISFLNLSTSRNVQDRNAVILRGFSTFSMYKKIRIRTGNLVARSIESRCQESSLYSQYQYISTLVKKVYQAEIQYNFARAFHHLNLLYLAMPLYFSCINTLDYVISHIKDIKEVIGSKGLNLPNILVFDVIQIRFSAIHNVVFIYRKRNDLKSATYWIERNYLAF